MSDQPTLIPMDVKTVNQIVEDRDRLATALGECAAAATKGAQQWLEEVNRLAAELSSYHAGLVHALGLPEDATKTEVVEAAARAWSYTQRHVEGVLVDEGVTELPGAWTQDDGPPSQDYMGDWAVGDLVQYDDHGCKFTARLVRSDGGRCWRATVETFEGSHDPEGVFAIGTEVGVVYGHSVKVWSAEAVSADVE